MVIDAKLPPENPEINFEDFFRNFEDEPNHFKYREMIQDAANRDSNVIYVLFEDILLYDPVLADFLREEPKIALEYAVEAFKELLRFYTGDEIDESRDYFVRITTKNNSCEVHLRELRAHHIDKLVYIHGILIRASQIYPQIEVATFECPVCRTQIEVQQIDSKLIMPSVCANPSCKNKKGFRIIQKDSKFIDWQSIRIQELPEELKPGRVPFSIKAILTHDLVDKVRPGERVKVMGIYRTYPNETGRGKFTRLFTPYIEVISVESSSAEEEELEITPEEIEEIHRWAKKKNIQKIIAKSLAPGIMGMDHLKLAACLALFGGVRKEGINGMGVRRGDIHVLFVGDPGTGKSQILKQCALVAPHPIYTSGKGSSAAGLTAAVVRDPDSGGFSLEAGALVLADGGNAMIDEFDKMDKNDRSAIHEAMEQQTVSIAKAGIVATLRARTSIIAAANPKNGRYDIYKTPRENIRLEAPILSRFDLIFVIKDQADEEYDRKMADFILNLHASGGNISAVRTDDDEELMPLPLLKKYIKYARMNIEPKLTPEAIEVIKEFYVKYRQKNKDDENAAFAVVARNLEGYIRLAEAYAKMALRNYVTREDAEEVLKLAERSLKDTCYDPITGTFDVYRVLTGAPSTKTLVFKFLEFLKRRIAENDGQPVDEEDFLTDAEVSLGVDRRKIEQLLNILVDEGTVYRPPGGKLQLAEGQG